MKEPWRTIVYGLGMRDVIRLHNLDPVTRTCDCEQWSAPDDTIRKEAIQAAVDLGWHVQAQLLRDGQAKHVRFLHDQHVKEKAGRPFEIERFDGGVRIGRWDLYLTGGRFLAYHMAKDGRRIIRWEFS